MIESDDKCEVLLAKKRITSRGPDGLIRKTELIEEVWTSIDTPFQDPDDPDIIYENLPVRRVRELLSSGEKIIRKVTP